MMPGSKETGPEVEVTVWSTVSLLYHVTAVPELTVMIIGWY